MMEKRCFFSVFGIDFGGLMDFRCVESESSRTVFCFVLVELKYFWPFVELGPSINDAWFQRYSTTDLIMLL